MEGNWVSYMVLPPAAGALPSAGLDGAAAADVGATVLVTVASAHPAAASSPHVPIASATRCLVMFMFPLRHTTPVFSRWFAGAERRGMRADAGLVHRSAGAEPTTTQREFGTPDSPKASRALVSRATLRARSARQRQDPHEPSHPPNPRPIRQARCRQQRDGARYAGERRAVRRQRR